MASRWRNSLLRRAFEEAIYALFETRERAMIAFMVAIVAIAAIWLMGEQDIARHELIIKLSASAVIFLFFPFVWGWKLFTIPKKPAQIVIGTGSPYETVEPSGVNRTRIVRAKLQNNTITEISNGEFHLRDLDPPNNGYKDFLLQGNITIGPQGHTVIGVAAYNEGTSEALAGSWIQLIIPPHDGYLMSSSFNHLPIVSHKFHLTFSSMGETLDEIYCRFFINSDHVLKLEEWS